MKHSWIINIPKKPKKIYDYALEKSYHHWVDEKSTEDNPSYSQRKLSKLTYKKAFRLINNNKPHWVISFRDNSNFGEKDYWEFGGCNISETNYGDVFLWILVDVDVGEEIIKKFKLIKNFY